MVISGKGKCILILIFSGIALLNPSYSIAEKRKTQQKEVVKKKLPPKKEVKSLYLTPDIGFLIPTSKVPVSLFTGLRGEYFLPFLNQMIFAGIGIDFSYGRKSGSVQDERVPDGVISYSTDVYTLPVMFEGGIKSPEIRGIALYGGFGLGMVWEKATEETTYQRYSQTGTGVATALFAGARVKLGSGLIETRLGFNYLQERMHITDTNQHGGMYFTVGYSLPIF